MKYYKVYIYSYETDNSCGTYNNEYDFPTFEEAQDFLEKKFLEYEEEHGLTKRDFEFNWITKELEEDPDSDYYYNFKITPISFHISGEWSDYEGEIGEGELVNELPYGRWRFVDKHGLPTKEGNYLVSISDGKNKFTTELPYDKKYGFELYEESATLESLGWKVYAWTDRVQPA